MDSSDDDEKLIQNSLLFISVRENKHVEEKIQNIKKCLREGADVNAVDANKNNVSPLHVAVRKGEADIVSLLKGNGADLNQRNSKGETPLDIAQKLIGNDKHEILNLLIAADQSYKKPTEIAQNVSQNNAKPKKATETKKKREYIYLKRTGTSGVCGQLYETKLLSLVLMRAQNDQEIELFYLGTNISGIGDLDDVCLRYQVKGHLKPIMIFMQAKHREDREKGRLTVADVRSPTGDFSLRKYFESYLTIKNRFQPKNKDVMFDGEFSSVDCNLIIYTPARDCFDKKRTDAKLSKKVHSLINTGQESEVFQFDYGEDDIDLLTKMTVIERIKKLGSFFLDSITKKDKSQLLNNELMVRYHVVMGREVLQPYRIQEQSTEHRMWEFRPDFFTSECDYLRTLKDTFYKELSATRYDKSDIDKKDVDHFVEMLDNPCASTIGKLIGKLVTIATVYDDKKTITNIRKLQLIEVNSFKKILKGDKLELLKQRLNELQINEDVIKEAIRIKLLSIELKLPLAFGNLDMTIRGKDDKVKSRVTTIAEKLIGLIVENEKKKNTKADNNLDSDKIIEIKDEIVGPGKVIEQGIVDINGGIGGAVGNLLIFDEETKMMKFDMENKTLPEKASLLLDELKDIKYNPINHELSNYRLKINIEKFPKDSFDGDEYDKRQARDFLGKLWFYANQAKEDEVEIILKKDINQLYNTEKGQNQFKFRVHTDAIFLRSHDEVQKWWMKTGEAAYLNKTSEIYEQAKIAVIDNPLLAVLNFMYNLKIQNIGIKFSKDAILALELDNIPEKLFNVITEANVFSGIKTIQHFEKKNNYTFIDFDYVLSLPLNDYNTMLQELTQTKLDTLIIVYEKLKYYEGLCNKLKEVIGQFKGSTIVLLSDRILADEIKVFIGDKYRSVIDNNTYLIDLTEYSQTKILQESKIVFQGDELAFEPVLYENARSLVRTEILYKLINREKIELGHTLIDHIYKNIDHFTDRTLCRDDDSYQVNTLDDIADKVVVVTGKPGMGRSALLTHLSLNTKLNHPLPWIVRVNLKYYEKEFLRWQEQDLTIDAPLVLHFLCTIALKNFNPQTELSYREGNIFVGHIDENIDPLAFFELELFLYLYNRGKVIFLFDDFNAICPHYEKEVIKILKMLRDEGKRMWIMTCPYKHTRKSLENGFTTPYKLKGFDTEEKKVFLNRFFRTNLKLEKLNYEQFENVRSFLKFMSKFTNMSLVSDPEREIVPLFSLAINLVYVIAAQFFQSEINRPSARTIRAKVRENFEIDLEQYSRIDELLGRTPDDEELELAGTPLHLYIAANYFKFRIEESLSFLLGEEEVRNKWDLIVNTFTLYRHFVEAHMQKIFVKEDSDDYDVISTYRQTRREFLEKHKKLGLFTICREKDLTKFLKPDEISEIQSTISKIERGEDRSSLVNCVVNEVPRFAHLVFAEYFAVEYLTEMLKSVEDNEHNPFMSASLWQSVLNLLLFNAPPGVRKAFDYKLQSDSTLASLASSDACREVVFELLLKQGRGREKGAGDEAGASTSDSPIADAFDDGLTNIFNLFLSSVQFNLNRGKVNEVAELLRHTGERVCDFGKEYAETIKNMYESVRDMDVGKLVDIVQSGRLTEVPLRHAANYCSSETATELQKHVDATASQLPVLKQNLQQLFQPQDGPTGSIAHTLTSLAELGVTTFLKDVLSRLKPPDPELD